MTLTKAISGLLKVSWVAIFVALLSLTTSCSNSKHLLGGESLYIGSKVKISKTEISAKAKKTLAADLVGVVRPKPNSKSLDIRFKLSLYNFAGDTKKKKGIRKWLRTKYGEPPVYTSSVNLPVNRNLMLNLLQNKGFFFAKVTSTVNTTKKNKSTIVFNVNTGPQYTINKSYFNKSAGHISTDIDSIFKETLLITGTPYNLDLIKAERVRIDRVLKEIGYFYFRPDYLVIIADTSIGENKVNMYVQLKTENIPEEAFNVYTIDSIYIFADYKLGGKRIDTSKADEVKIDNYYVIDKKHKFKPAIFSDAMIFEKGDKYSLDDQNTSLSRLVNMGVFKFVKNRFETNGDSLMDVYYYLTPYPKKSLRFEAGVLTQNDNRAGTEGSVSWRNRNAFKGAEELLFKINGGFEAQYSGSTKRPTIYSFGAETSLSLPKLAVPFVSFASLQRYLPHTIVKLKFNYESAADLLRIKSYNATYGYNWKMGQRTQHQLFPVSFTLVKTDTLGDKGALKSVYNNLIFNGIILGSTYQYTYNSLSSASAKSSFYFDGLIDVAGNVLGLLKGADYTKKQDLLFGSAYVQYVKLQPDFRYYYKLGKASTLASRIMAGIGIPYGNSSQLPNVKQFWAGGNSDLRGFPSRLVGPGTYNKNIGTKNYIETLGDLKLEGNIEFREHLYKFLNLGLFVDAGNIWLYRDSKDLPGGKLTSNFYKELAIDAGFGLRFDFSILILRLDLGMPIRKPWLPEAERWVINKVAFADPTWKKDNLVFNIAIGYPF